MGRRRGAAALAILSLTAPLYLLGAFATAGVSAWSHARQLRASARLVVFLDDDASAGDRTRIEARLRGPETRTFVFVDREEARRRMKDAIDTSTLAESPFPASYEVVVARLSAKDATAFADALRGLEGVEEVASEVDLIERLTLLERIALLVLLALGTILVVALVVMIGNTVKLVFVARADEVALLQVMGAPEAFIAGPFVVEGALLGFSSGFVAAAGLGMTRALASSLVPATLPMLALAIRQAGVLPAILLLPPFGMVVGLGATRAALRRLLASPA
ncbi:MAG: permease-like cell division protein FtsX [Acidobacteriota bacterium]